MHAKCDIPKAYIAAEIPVAKIITLEKAEQSPIGQKMKELGLLEVKNENEDQVNQNTLLAAYILEE